MKWCSRRPSGRSLNRSRPLIGYHLILVEERKSKPFEDARAEIEQKIRPEMGQKAIEGLKAKTTIVYDDEYFGKQADLPPAK